MCARCGSHIEMTTHCFRDCAFSRHVWEGNMDQLNGGYTTVKGDFLNWVFEVYFRMSKDNFDLFCIIIWWHARNEMVASSDEITRKPTKILAFAKDYFETVRQSTMLQGSRQIAKCPA
ncbi:hypothetical protein U1Q18_042256 [Sarracenia purpurea var. burkii]